MQRKLFSPRGVAVEATLLGMMAVGVALGSAGFAAADPEEPAPPPPPGAGLIAGPVDSNVVADSPPPANPGITTMGPLGAVAGNAGLNDLMLGQNPVPSVDGGAGALPTTDMLQAGQFLYPQNYRMPSVDQNSPYVLTEGTPPGPFARIDGMKGAHALAHGAIGRMPIGELGQPLPGTAPPPGTNIPMGPVDNLPDPAAPQPFLPPLPPLG